MMPKKQSTGIAIAPQWNEEQIGLVKRTVMPPNSTNDELAMFGLVAQRTGLDPFARQIYALRRGDKLSFQVSIDGMRTVAERSGKYAGQQPPQWCGEDGQWKDVWIDAKPPAAARVAVLRSDFSEPCVAIATYKSYAQTSSPTWQKMPDVMLAKCAESLALRRAFPQELSGLYSQEEMDQAESPEVRPTVQIVSQSPVRDAEEAIEATTVSTPTRTANAPSVRAGMTKNANQHKSSEVDEINPARPPIGAVIQIEGDEDQQMYFRYNKGISKNAMVGAFEGLFEVDERGEDTNRKMFADKEGGPKNPAFGKAINKWVEQGCVIYQQPDNSFKGKKPLTTKQVESALEADTLDADEIQAGMDAKADKAIFDPEDL